MLGCAEDAEAGRVKTDLASSWVNALKLAARTPPVQCQRCWDNAVPTPGAC
jgi:hypothetical protein